MAGAAPLELVRSPHSAAVFSAAASSMSVHSTVAPLAARACAVARPMPLPAPVTSAVADSKRIGGRLTRQRGRSAAVQHSSRSDRTGGPGGRSGRCNRARGSCCGRPHRGTSSSTHPSSTPSARPWPGSPRPSAPARRTARRATRAPRWLRARRAPITWAICASIMTTSEVWPIPVLGPASMKKLGNPGMVGPAVGRHADPMPPSAP